MSSGNWKPFTFSLLQMCRRVKQIASPELFFLIGPLLTVCETQAQNLPFTVEMYWFWAYTCFCATIIINMATLLTTHTLKNTIQCSGFCGLKASEVKFTKVWQPSKVTVICHRRTFKHVQKLSNMHLYYRRVTNLIHTDDWNKQWTSLYSWKKKSDARKSGKLGGNQPHFCLQNHAPHNPFL